MTNDFVILSDGRPGHLTQSHGLLDLLGDLPGSRQELLLPAPRRWLKRVVLLLARLPAHSPAWHHLLLRLYYRQLPACPSGSLLVSTGGDTLVANLLLARCHRLPNVFIGKPDPLSLQGCSLVVTTSALPADDPGAGLRVALAPVRASVSQTPAAPDLMAVLMGGNSHEYAYTRDDYEALATALNSFCDRTGMRLLITSSRRTGEAGESCLRAMVAPEHVADATWYGTAPRPTAGAYASRAALIACSEDSGSMLTESLAHGKPVVAFRPDTLRLTPFYQDFLSRLTRQGVWRCRIADLATLDPAAMSPVTAVDYEPLIARLTDLLQPPPDQSCQSPAR